MKVCPSMWGSGQPTVPTYQRDRRQTVVYLPDKSCLTNSRAWVDFDILPFAATFSAMPKLLDAVNRSFLYLYRHDSSWDIVLINPLTLSTGGCLIGSWVSSLIVCLISAVYCMHWYRSMWSGVIVWQVNRYDTDLITRKEIAVLNVQMIYIFLYLHYNKQCTNEKHTCNNFAEICATVGCLARCPTVSSTALIMSAWVSRVLASVIWSLLNLASTTRSAIAGIDGTTGCGSGDSSQHRPCCKHT